MTFYDFTRIRTLTSFFFAALAHMMKYLQGKFRALGNIGDVLMKMRSYDEAVKVYQKQLVLAKQCRDKVLEASAYGALGLAHRLLKCFDKALGYHTQVWIFVCYVLISLLDQEDMCS